MKDYNTIFGYKPYEGGAGPSKSEEANFASMLYCALFDAKLQPMIEIDEDETIFVITRGGSRKVCYDRWGYCNEGDPDVELDQVDLNAAVAYFLEER